MKKLRPYQKEAKETVFKKLEVGLKKPIVVLPTGCGKTFCASKITDEFKNTLWLTHTEELIDQSALALVMNITEKPLEVDNIIADRNGMLEFLNFAEKNPLMLNDTERFIYDNCGIIKAERMDIDKKITVASIQTIHRRLHKIDSDKYDLIIIDECHQAAAKTWNKTIEHFSEAKLVLGLTATPHRTDGTSLNSVFDEIVYDYSIKDAIEQGYLCEIDAIRIKTNISLDNVRTTAGELNNKDLAIINCPERNNLIVDSFEKYVKEKQGIIFCVNVQHAMDLTATFKKRGYNSVNFVVGDKNLCPNRKDIIRDYKKGRIQVLINVMVLTMGFDHPNTGFVGMTCPTKSLVKYIQCIGRGTRLKNKKYIDKYGQKVTILDFVDVTSRHRLVNTWELDKEKEIEDRVYLSKEKKDKLIKVREERLAKLDVSRNRDEKVNLLSLPKVKINKTANSNKPASPKQLLFLNSLGYDVKNNFYTVYDASLIISSQPIKKQHLMRLKLAGYDISKGATYGEAKLVFDELKNKLKTNQK